MQRPGVGISGVTPPAPEHLLDGTTPSKAHPWTPAEAKPGKPAEAAKPSSPKSATAKEPEADDAPSSGKGAACSFDPATPVLLDDGSTKSIADVTVGDKVQDADPATGKHTTSNKVTATWINHDSDLIDVTIQGAEGKPATLHTTANHPFWDATTHSWTPAGDLHPGDALTTAANTEARVLALRITPGTANRYNLTVDHVHTYYVLAGTTPVLVHNCGDADEPVKLYRSPQKGNRDSEVGGLNPENHRATDLNGRNFAYLGNSHSVVRQYAGQGVYEDGYHVFTMKPGFLDEFHPSVYRRFHDDDGGLQWIIEDMDFDDFNSFIDHDKTEWVPWKKGVHF